MVIMCGGRGAGVLDAMLSGTVVEARDLCTVEEGVVRVMSMVLLTDAGEGESELWKD
jgi:hypothetical protein